MTTSTTEDEALSSQQKGGAFADALTLVRLLLTPFVMGLILWRWPDPQIAILASSLFLIAALTDIFDDWFGGSSRSAVRRYGYLDDIADMVLIMGALIALSIVIYRNELMHWAFAVPVAVLVGREVLVGLVKGYELSRFGWPDNWLSNAKSGFGMLGTVLFVGSPWITQMFDRVRASSETVIEVYGGGSPLIWVVGQVCLWIAAIASILSAIQIVTSQQTNEEVAQDD